MKPDGAAGNWYYQMIKWKLYCPSKVFRNFYRRIFRSISKALVSVVPDDPIPNLSSEKSRDEDCIDVMLFNEIVRCCYTVHGTQYAQLDSEQARSELIQASELWVVSCELWVPKQPIRLLLVSVPFGISYSCYNVVCSCVLCVLCVLCVWYCVMSTFRIRSGSDRIKKWNGWNNLFSVCTRTDQCVNFTLR
jgi:hypothetical protein